MNITGTTSSPHEGAPEPIQHKETVNYVKNFNRQGNNPYSNTYNRGWRNHPNFTWSNNSGQKNNPPPGFQQQNKDHKHEKEPRIPEVLAQLKKYDAMFQSQSTSIRHWRIKLDHWPMLTVTDRHVPFLATLNQIRGTWEMSNVMPSC